MKSTKLRVILFCLVTFLLALPVAVSSAGGRLEGKVSDPKGAAVEGAAVTATDAISNQKFSAVTDAKGRYHEIDA